MTAPITQLILMDDFALQTFEGAISLNENANGWYVVLPVGDGDRHVLTDEHAEKLSGTDGQMVLAMGHGKPVDHGTVRTIGRVEDGEDLMVEVDAPGRTSIPKPAGESEAVTEVIDRRA